jgi:hypothetical protein
MVFNVTFNNISVISWRSVLLVEELDLQLPVQSVPITTKIVSLIRFNGEVYIQHYAIKFVSDLRHVGGFFRVLRIPQPIKLTSTI